MLPSQRRQAILAAVRAEDGAAADDLARQFDVSVETIRRDLRALHSEGLLERVYGGAARPAGRSDEGSFSARTGRHVDLKRAIAALAASLVEPEDTIVIDVGTTPQNGVVVGDVDRETVEPVAGWLTPVPGGVGPMTIAMLLRNTLALARARRGRTQA